MRAASILSLIALLCAGCAAPATRVVLLPQARGTGAVEVTTPTTSQRLDHGYAEAAVQGSGAIALKQLDAEQVKSRHGPLLAVQPASAQDFTLYFETGGTELTAQSGPTWRPCWHRHGRGPAAKSWSPAIPTASARWRATTRCRCSARAIRERIIADGFDPNRIMAVGRGEREPAVDTPDEVAEPRNRRSEVIVR
jgi:hypothetical protein